MAKNLYVEKPRKRTTQKIDNTGLAKVPNYQKKVDKKAAHNSREIGKMKSIIWME